jgi:hypothetical protein
MTIIFVKPENVLTLAGIALADLTLLVLAQQYVPTLHLSKTSFWSGTKINQIRFGSYPDTGLIELARAEAVARAGTWDSWAFGSVAVSPTDQAKPVLLVEAGDAPLANIVRIIQKFRPPKEGFCLIGSPRFNLNIQGKILALDNAQISSWKNLLHMGIGKLRTAGENWERWSEPRGWDISVAPVEQLRVR